MDAKAHEASQRILDEHREITAMLDELDVLVGQFEAGGSGIAERLSEHARRLYARFAEHLDLEEGSLGPLLRAKGPEGEQHWRRLTHEHHEQRELLKYLLSRLSSDTPFTGLMAQEMRNFAQYLRSDMHHEEELMAVRSPG